MQSLRAKPRKFWPAKRVADGGRRCVQEKEKERERRRRKERELDKKRQKRQKAEAKEKEKAAAATAGEEEEAPSHLESLLQVRYDHPSHHGSARVSAHGSAAKSWRLVCLCSVAAYVLSSPFCRCLCL